MFHRVCARHRITLWYPVDHNPCARMMTPSQSHNNWEEENDYAEIPDKNRDKMMCFLDFTKHIRKLEGKINPYTRTTHFELGGSKNALVSGFRSTDF